VKIFTENSELLP